MRALNRRLEVDGVAVARRRAGGARHARTAGDRLATRRASASMREPSVGAGSRSCARSSSTAARSPSACCATCSLSSVSLVVAALVAIPFGLALERRRALAEPLVRVTGLLQTIPGIALLAFMIPVLGIGIVPALVALFVVLALSDRAEHVLRRARRRSGGGERGARAGHDARAGAAATCACRSRRRRSWRACGRRR